MNEKTVRVLKIAGGFMALGGLSYAWARLAGYIKDETEDALLGK